ncbi:hypothetical protein KSP40_PGU018042 [Platanthera guangdongensis]|uniref:Secreted protein n=1 Tax=Platanthera guangdongensis TaxID=2320717 RepID=A0ABR2MLK9_9ASPA
MRTTLGVGVAVSPVGLYWGRSWCAARVWSAGPLWPTGRTSGKRCVNDPSPLSGPATLKLILRLPRRPYSAKTEFDVDGFMWGPMITPAPAMVRTRGRPGNAGTGHNCLFFLSFMFLVNN